MGKWKKIPDSEIERLARTLDNHLKKLKIRKSKEERKDFVKTVLMSQKRTCAYAGDNDSYCWNRNKNKEYKYLRLEWGHKIPKSSGKKDDSIDNLILLCGRCNNQIQTSRTIEQLIPELEHKLHVLKKINYNSK